MVQKDFLYGPAGKCLLVFPFVFVLKLAVELTGIGSYGLQLSRSMSEINLQ